MVVSDIFNNCISHINIFLLWHHGAPVWVLLLAQDIIMWWDFFLMIVMGLVLLFGHRLCSLICWQLPQPLGCCSRKAAIFIYVFSLTCTHLGRKRARIVTLARLALFVGPNRLHGFSKILDTCTLYCLIHLFLSFWSWDGIK